MTVISALLAIVVLTLLCLTTCAGGAVRFALLILALLFALLSWAAARKAHSE